MPLALLLLGLIVARCALGADVPLPRAAPVYSAASIVNAADNQSGTLAPNTLGTIYGVNLAFSTAALSETDIHGGLLPVLLGDSQTTVYFDNYPAGLYYVSPGQINFLVPPNQSPGPVSVRVLVNSSRGPIIQLTLAAAAPGLFAMVVSGVTYAIATRVDGSLLTPSPSSQAKPGDIVVLYATGLGQTEGLQPENYLQLPTVAASLVAGANLKVLLDGVAVESSAIGYAGVAPGYGGLYQVNLTLPKSTGKNPEIRLQLDGASSIAGVHLPVSP